LGLLAYRADASGSDTMSGHTDAVARTVWHQTRSEGASGVGVVSRTTQPGFLQLNDAMYRRTYLELGALPTAPACARAHTQQLLWEWGLSRLADSSIAVVSELVTNAVETTIRHQLGTPIALRLSSNGQQVLIEIWDADPTPPQVPALDANRLPLPDAEDGRGLFLVGALSERWSCYTVEARGGKVIWAEVSA
jgi:anti-sigma regulatory factor (Ser/Thr protein kinase)